MTKKRCQWSLGSFEEYVRYHDDEWGVPVHDDRKHFEFLILEGAQAGLSWSTVLRKRAGYAASFSNFDVEAVARYDEQKINHLIAEGPIIKNKLKIRSAVTNAQAFIAVQEEFGSFDDYIWQFVDGAVIHGHWKRMDDVPATTPESDALSKDLKKRGFKFVGSTIMYAHMQAVGMVNDHTTDCYRYQELLS